MSFINELIHNQFVGGIIVASVLGSVVKLLFYTKSYFVSQFITYVGVDSYDSSFNRLSSWLISTEYGKKAKNIKMTDGPFGTLETLGFGTHYLCVNGNFIIVNLSRSVKTGFSDKAHDYIGLSIPFCKKTTLEIVIQAMQPGIITGEHIDIFLYNYGWCNITRCSGRDIKSVHLPNNEVSKMVNDIEQFIANKQLYVQRQIAYKRCYLLHGTPGCGKTSLIKALATYLCRSIYMVDLKTINSDFEFIYAISRTPKNSIIVLEEIDSINFGGRLLKNNELTPIQLDTSNDKVRVSIGTVLSVLDGMYSSDDKLIMMTTNYIDRIDERILRDGRVDYKLRFSEMKNISDVKMQYLNFHGAEDGFDEFVKNVTLPITGAAVQELLFKTEINKEKTNE